MKVIIVSPAYPLRGGIAESTELLYKEYLKSGIECEIMSYSLQYPGFLFPGKTQKVNDLKKNNLQISSLLNSINPISWYKVSKKIISKEPDYVILRYWNPFFAPCLSFIASKLKSNKIPVIAWVDNINPHDGFVFQNKLTKYFLNKVNSALVMSSSVKNDLLKLYPNFKVKFSPHPIYNNFGPIVSKENARSNLKLDLSSKYILFFGFIRKYKGLDLLLDSISDSRFKQKNIKLIVAGEFYDKKSAYTDKIKKLKLESSVILFDNYINNSDVAKFFCASNLVVQPYLSATQSGVSMIAFHFLKPVLVTKTGGLTEYVNHNKDGYVVDCNAKMIADSILDYFENDREEYFSSNLKGKLIEFSWPKLLGNFEKLYLSEK